MKKSYLIAICVILLSFLIGIYLYTYMPERMASHWNALGEVNGYMPRFWGLFLMPFVSILMLILFVIIPAIDPLNKNIEKFRSYYDIFVVIMISFLFYLYLLTLFWNLGSRFNLPSFLAPAFGVLLFYCGVLISNAKRNWSIGIRTPWTLSSDVVWERTHDLGGRLFKISGLISLLGVFLPEYAIIFVIIPSIFSAIFSFFASYLFYLQEGKLREWNVKEKR